LRFNPDHPNESSLIGKAEDLDLKEFVLLKSVNQVNINKASGFNGTFKLATVKNDLTL
jgi:hypothetical protein